MSLDRLQVDGHLLDSMHGGIDGHAATHSSSLGRSDQCGGHDAWWSAVDCFLGCRHASG